MNEIKYKIEKVGEIFEQEGFGYIDNIDNDEWIEPLIKGDYYFDQVFNIKLLKEFLNDAEQKGATHVGTIFSYDPYEKDYPPYYESMQGCKLVSETEQERDEEEINEKNKLIEAVKQLKEMLVEAQNKLKEYEKGI